MTDELTRAIAEALGCEPADFWPWRHLGQPPMTTCATHNSNGAWPCTEARRVAAAIAPLIEARVREARVDALTEAADAWTQGAWASTPRHKDRVADRMAASQYAGDWLRERAEEMRR